MTLETLHSKLIKFAQNQDFIQFQNIINELEEEIRKETCYKTTSKTRVNAIKRVVPKDNTRPALKGYTITKDNYKLFTDGYHLVAIKQDKMPIPLVATDEKLKEFGIGLDAYRDENGLTSVLNYEYPNVENLLNYQEINEVELDLNDIATYYKLNRKEAEDKPYYIKGIEEQGYNIQYIKNVIDILGTNVRAFNQGKHRPLYIVNENNEIGLILPLIKY